MPKKNSPGCNCCNPCDRNYSDDFSSALNDKWLSAHNVSVSGGRLVAASASSASAGRCCVLPELDGLAMSVSAKIFDAPSSSTTGVGMSNSLSAPWEAVPFALYARWHGIVEGEPIGNFAIEYHDNGTPTFETFEAAGPPASGDTIKLEIVDTSSGAGTYTVNAYVNAVLEKTVPDVQFTWNDPFYSGVLASLIGGFDSIGEWDDYQFSS
jgi:hypothetical protein